MVPKRLIYTWLLSITIIFIMVLGAYQYANYVDRSSNQRWCALILLFNDSYRENPPTTELGRTIASEMLKIQKDFSCTESKKE